MYAIDNGFFGILWEGLMINDILMQIVPEEISTSCATMSVVYRKEA